MTLAPGTRLGPYEIVGQIGAGGMGEVWKARDARLGRDVAIKVLPPAFAADPDRLKRFEQEARAVSALSHPNVLTLHDIGTFEGAPYLVMELLEGQTLRERLPPEGLPVRQVLDLGLQIAHGLSAAHEKGIIHRDLKPENVFITRQGHVKILDFGLAKLRSGGDVFPGMGTDEEATLAVLRNEAHTEAGMVMGTVAYMSPEQAQGQVLDGRSDLFTLGVILWEMVTGSRPFQRGSMAATLQAILHEDPPQLACEPAVPPVLERILVSCLSKHPEGRFHSAHDLAFALQTALDSGPSSTPFRSLGSASKGRAGMWLRPWRWVGLLVVGLSLALWLWLGRSQPSAAIASLAVLPLQNYSGDAQQEFFVDGMTDALIADLAQIKALKVISRTSVMQYKGTKKPIPQIAKELGVQGILEGSVLRIGNRVRITAQLIDAARDTHLWASNYERDLTDVLSLQKEVVREIATQIRVQVSAEEQRRLHATRKVQPEVLDLTMKAWAVAETAIRESDVRRSIAMFQAAIEKDPNHAPAWAGLAYTTWTLTGAGWEFVSPDEVRETSISAANRAIELDPELPEAHWARGMVACDAEWDHIAGRRHYEKALELRPGFASCHAEYGQVLIGMGDLAEAAQHLERARELNPFSPYNALNRIWFLNASGDPARAIQESKQMKMADPTNWTIPYNTGVSYLMLGQPAAAATEFESCLKGEDRPFAILGLLGLSYGLAGRTNEAQRILFEFERAERKHYVSPVMKACVQLGLGRHADAYDSLEKAYRSRAGSLLSWFGSSHGYSPLISGYLKDSRWPNLREQIQGSVKSSQASGAKGLPASFKTAP